VGWQHWSVGSTKAYRSGIVLSSGIIQHSRKTLLETSRGTGLQHINQGVCWDLPVPLPPLPEQQRIVTRLEVLLDRVDACQNSLAKIPFLPKRFRKCVLADACSGRLTADWREKNGVTDAFDQTTVEAIADYVGGFAYKSSTFLERGKTPSYSHWQCPITLFEAGCFTGFYP
jgi:type I restriction modification DNA specificity protein